MIRQKLATHFNSLVTIPGDGSYLTWNLRVVENRFVEDACSVDACLGRQPHGQGVGVVVHPQVDLQDALDQGLGARSHPITRQHRDVQQGA